MNPPGGGLMMLLFDPAEEPQGNVVGQPTPAPAVHAEQGL
jgi:hypothetical protein